MCLQFAVNTALAWAVLMGAVSGCAKKEVDPVAELKALIPVIEQRLNKRDLARLKGMGTDNFESNAFVIDVFGEHVRDSVRLSLDRIQQDGTDATLLLNMASMKRPAAGRTLRLHLQGNGKWKIDSYEIIVAPADTLGRRISEPHSSRFV